MSSWWRLKTGKGCRSKIYPLWQFEKQKFMMLYTNKTFSIPRRWFLKPFPGRWHFQPFPMKFSGHSWSLARSRTWPCSWHGGWTVAACLSRISGVFCVFWCQLFMYFLIHFYSHAYVYIYYIYTYIYIYYIPYGFLPHVYVLLFQPVISYCTSQEGCIILPGRRRWPTEGARRETVKT